MSDVDTPDQSTDIGAEDLWLAEAEDDEIIEDDAQLDEADKPASEEAEEEKPDAEKPEDGGKADQPADAGKDDQGENAEKPKDGEPEKEPDADKPTEQDAEARKRYNDEQAKQRIAAKQALTNTAKSHIEQAQAELDEAGDDETKKEIAQLKLKDAQREADDFVRNVEHNHSIMQNDYSRAQREIPMFRELNDDGTPNPKFVRKAYDLALEHLAPYLITEKMQDDDGKEQLVILGSSKPVYDFLKQEADSFEDMFGEIKTEATVEGQRSEQKMRGAAEPVSGGSPVTKTGAADKEAKEMSDAFDSV